MGKLGTLDYKDEQIINRYVTDSTSVQRLYAQDAIIKLRESKLGIFVQARDLHFQGHGSYDFIKGKARLINSKFGFNGKVEIDCIVACGNLYKLGNLKGEINIVDHFNLLLPKNRECIGLFTFQNGIQNTLGDFEEMGESIIKNLSQEKPLCIGLYNDTCGIKIGIYNDVVRLMDEWNLNSSSVLMIRQMCVTFAELLPSINRNMLWAHITHSEAGLIANEVLTTKQNSLSHRQYEMLKKHLITASYGAVAPIPDIVRHAVNTYSIDDVTMFFAKKYLNKFPRPASTDDAALKQLAKDMYNYPMFPKNQSIDSIYAQLKAGANQFYISQYPYTSTKDGCTVTIVESLVPKAKQPLIEKDHAFQGDTYQTALEDNIRRFRGDYKIYDANWMD